MTDQFVQFAASLGAVAALVVLTHFLGFSAGSKLGSEEEARALLRLAPGGFEPVVISLDRQGRGAIAQDSQRLIAVLVPHGGRFVVRLLSPDARLAVGGEMLKVECATLGPRTITLMLGESADDWATEGGSAS